MVQVTDNGPCGTMCGVAVVVVVVSREMEDVWKGRGRSGEDAFVTVDGEPRGFRYTSLCLAGPVAFSSRC